MPASILTGMERSRNGLVPLFLPALVLVPLAGFAIVFFSIRWFNADAQSAVRHRLVDATADVSRQLDEAVGRQAESTRALGSSPMVWLWVKFQGERLTQSNLFHAQTALAEVTNYASLLPGVSVYLASERTRTIYQDGAAVAAISQGDPRDAWYAASLRTEGVLVSDDLRTVRTSMRVMNGRTLLGALTCVRGVSVLAAAAFDGAPEKPGLSFALTDGEGVIVAARGEGTAAAATVFDLFGTADRAGIRAAMGAVVRPGAMTVDAYAGKGRRMFAAVTRTAAPGWYLFVLTDLPRVPAARGAVLAGVAAAALALLVAALILIGRARARRTDALVLLLTEERNAAAGTAREVGAAALRLRAAAIKLRERAAALTTEAASGATSGNAAAGLLARAEDVSAEVRSGFAARLPLLTEIASSARDAAAKSRDARSAAQTASLRAAEAEEELNRVITAGSAVSLAVENAMKEVGGVVQAAERTRLLALNAALEASRSGSQSRGGARVADDMRRLAEEAAAHSQALASALEEARANARVVSRAAQDAGAAVHNASAGSSDSARVLDSAWNGVDGVLSRVEAAGGNAVRLREEVGTSDRGRSAVVGVTRVMARIEDLCTEIAALAAAMSAESAQTAQKASGSGRLTSQDRLV
jgi:methyl-accepting chemotaxis protein